MLTVQAAYIQARKKMGDSKLTSILDFGTDFGFLFGDAEGNTIFGASYILINKRNGELGLIPTTPINVQKIQSAKSIPLSIIKIK